MRLIIALIFVSTLFSVNGQLKKQKSTLEGFYGFPNFFDVTTVTMRYLGHQVHLDSTSNKFCVGLAFEKFKNHRLSYSYETTYNQVDCVVKREWTEETKFQDSYGDYHTSYTHKEKYNHFRAMRLSLAWNANFHFVRVVKKWDGYITVGLGAYLRLTKPLDENDTDLTYLNSVMLKVTPVFKFGIGCRYYFNKHIGINAACKVGGTLFTTGITYRF